jgi:hypothetical protein
MEEDLTALRRHIDAVAMLSVPKDKDGKPLPKT